MIVQVIFIQQDNRSQENLPMISAGLSFPNLCGSSSPAWHQHAHLSLRTPHKAKHSAVSVDIHCGCLLLEKQLSNKHKKKEHKQPLCSLAKYDTRIVLKGQYTAISFMGRPKEVCTMTKKQFVSSSHLLTSKNGKERISNST